MRITFTTAQVSYSTLAASLPATIKDTHYDILNHCEQHFCQTGSLDAILETNNSVSFTLEGPQSKSKGLWGNVIARMTSRHRLSRTLRKTGWHSNHIRQGPAPSTPLGLLDCTSMLPA